MLYINCPHCGMRSQNEFSYGGDASVKRPELNKEVSDQEWDDFVYNRKSLRGKHLELWQHISGCRQWIKVERDTATHGSQYLFRPLSTAYIPRCVAIALNAFLSNFFYCKQNHPTLDQKPLYLTLVFLHSHLLHMRIHFEISFHNVDNLYKAFMISRFLFQVPFHQ